MVLLKIWFFLWSLMVLESRQDQIQYHKLVYEMRIVQVLINSILVISIVDVGSQHTVLMPRIGLFVMWIF